MSERRIRVRGKPRNEIDLDLVVQALLLIGEQRWRELRGETDAQDQDALPGKTDTEGRS